MRISERIIAKKYAMQLKDKRIITKEDYNYYIIGQITKYRTLNDFMVDCVVRNNIPFFYIPNEIVRDVSFLIKLCNKDITKLNDVYNFYQANSKEMNKTFVRVLDGIDDLEERANNRKLSKDLRLKIAIYLRNRLQANNENVSNL